MDGTFHRPLTACRAALYTGAMSTVSAYFNGEWIPSSELRIPVDDLGFLLGATVTERLRTFRGQVFRLDEHLLRLRSSLEIVGLDSDAIADQVARAVPEFVRRNQGLIDAGRRLVDRRVRDAGRRGQQPADGVRPRLSAAVPIVGVTI